jgi:hypothetical protein
MLRLFVKWKKTNGQNNKLTGQNWKVGVFLFIRILVYIWAADWKIDLLTSSLFSFTYRTTEGRNFKEGDWSFRQAGIWERRTYGGGKAKTRIALQNYIYLSHYFVLWNSKYYFHSIS